ncbi:hypothetical protein [Haliscomenobacter hydrossis]|uniref:Lipoprotein n=1 Tax=Haliscomenobacter hydrossis (strain ATCC 27775 / DSM 1100 / LMG 10767 / O) TaxID=760192 RepID=F4KV65_HALH1|nr:hypothetical protein [Haliscomenobacter hydrossis]AEE49231.1 hypothetical protein Halhy_1336 [Haliscomenobacter hydrossis DSM 1100]
MKLNLFSSIIILMGLISACECDDMTPTKPERDVFNQEFYVDKGAIALTNKVGHYLVSMYFIQPIDQRSAQIDKSIILHGFKAISEVAVVEGGNYLFFYAERVDCQNCIPEIILKGDGPFPIKSTKGYFLDGNKDGLPGGDYTLEMK